MEITISYLDKDENEKEISLDVSASLFYDGIGPYEFWGQKGFDKGELCLDIEEVSYDKTGLTQAEIDQIEEYIESEKFYSLALKECLDRRQAAKEDAYEARIDFDY